MTTDPCPTCGGYFVTSTCPNCWTVDLNTVVGQSNEVIECYVDRYPDTIPDRDLAERVAAALNAERPDPATGEPWRGLVSELVDEEECRYDHHGYCQTHALAPYPCPHTRARAALIREQEAGR